MIDTAIVLLVIAGFIGLGFYARACRSQIRPVDDGGAK
jgi:hypothetical protein